MLQFITVTTGSYVNPLLAYSDLKDQTKIEKN